MSTTGYRPWLDGVRGVSILLVITEHLPFIALTYLTNYATVLAGHYLPAYGHTWSLAVEEHFYLLWPLALIGMLKRGSLAFAFRVTLTICVAVFIWRLILDIAGSPLRLLYVGSFERADTLLYGCAAAIAVLGGWKPGVVLFLAGVSMVGGDALNRATPVSALASATTRHRQRMDNRDAGQRRDWLEQIDIRVSTAGLAGRVVLWRVLMARSGASHLA